MVNVDQIERGIVKYLDENLIPNLPLTGKYDGLLKAGIGMTIAIAIKRFDQKVEVWRNMPSVKFLGIFDDKGNVDLDTLKTEFVKHMPPEGFVIEIPGGIDMTLKEADIQQLYNTIVQIG